ncbi:SUMF1/EgtB/PvdO family nonheme iron enzyme [Cytophagaceae bacterium ABcell3]|nr:SUMF1/EgtB/PvdO family nonheme iron enzyme [Cytophagaceae bacterium ABcell3]
MTITTISYPITASDTNLLNRPPLGISYKDTIPKFYMSDHEVTNGEYQQFVNWVKDSLLKTEPAVEVYSYRFTDQGKQIVVNVKPDTTVWIKDFRHSIIDPELNYYHSNPTTTNFPVVGVSAIQARAYCHWMTRQFETLLEKYNIETGGEFRLPTLQEWERGAQESLTKDNIRYVYNQLYPWGSHRLHDVNGYYANFGTIRDQNNIVSKVNYEDNYIFTAPVKSFKPTQTGLFDMAGNVSEWTSTSLDKNSVIQNYKEVYKELTGSNYDFLFPELCGESPDWRLFEEHVKQEKNHSYNATNGWEMERILFSGKQRKEEELHNLMVLEHSDDLLIVKGGSWNDPPVYLQNSVNQVYSEKAQHSTIGFRLALTLHPELEKLLGNKFKEQSSEKVKFKPTKNLK